MHTRGTRVLLRHYLEQGVGKAELARRFGVSRRTVYHWIETGQRVFEEIRAAGYAYRASNNLAVARQSGWQRITRHLDHAADDCRWQALLLDLIVAGRQ
jgi:transposase-like protein